MTQQEFIALIGPKATKDYQKTGVLASVTIAQACLESAYGTSELGVNAHNLFGMKSSLSGNTWKSVWKGDIYTKKTGEEYVVGKPVIITADFRKYDTWDLSLEDHSLYLTQAKKGTELRYKGLTIEKNYRKALQIIKDGGYATSSKYVDNLCAVVEKWNLTKFDVLSAEASKEEETMEINKMITKYNHTSGNTSRIKYIVIHYVGATGDAKANCNYYAGGNRNASAHYFVGFAGDVWQSVEDKDIAWHCGASTYKHPQCRNTNSIGIEMCVRNKGDKSATSKDWYFEDATVKNTIELTKMLMKKYNIPSTNVIRHYDVTGKVCPNPYVYNHTKYTWDAFKKALDGTSTPVVTPAPSAPASTVSSYIVQVTASALNVRKGPAISYAVTTIIKDKGKYTIVEEKNGWGRLKSGAGWINLSYTKRV